MYAAWIYLGIAVVFEVAWAISLKWTEGYTRLWPSVISSALVIANVVFLSKAIKVLPTTTAYTIWTGLGVVGVTVCAILFQGENWGYLRLICIALIIIGVVGLRLLTAEV